VTDAGTVAVTDHPFRDLDIERSILEPHGYRVAEHQCSTTDEVAEACADAVGVLNTYAPMTADVIGRLERCRAIGRYGVGVDTIDLEAATARGILVSNVPDYCVEEVALHTIALLLSAHRRVVQGDRLVRGGKWGALTAGPVRRLEGQLLGLIGCGRIPRAVAGKARALGLRVAAYDPFVPDDEWPEGVERYADLGELAADADFLSVHAPLTDETRHMVDEAVLRRMAEHAVLVNTARGPLVDTEALDRALAEGWIGGAALDVLEAEPPPPDLPLLRRDDLVVTAHQAFYSEEALRELQRKAAENLLDALAGRRPRYLVNAEAMAEATS
jgi:D-3-phosphoglycerate dehydrogenase / 2-oxoglutarate reductase